LDIIAGKTGTLFEASCLLGAALAGGDEAARTSLGRYGYNFGIAFQIMDDLLDIMGEERELGKSLGSDIASGKLTLPGIALWRRLDPKEKQRVREMILSDGRTEARQLVAALIERYQLGQYAAEKARLFVQKAKQCLSGYDHNPLCRSLQLLAEFVISTKPL
jgi:octaprenyl-diphosphate synthase